jgi:hypothetical protein
VVPRRVHSHYQRKLADTASGGQEVLIHLQARRFFCGSGACVKVTFAEQVPGLTGPLWPADYQPGRRAAGRRYGAGRPGRRPADRQAGLRGEPLDADPADPRRAGPGYRDCAGTRRRFIPIAGLSRLLARLWRDAVVAGVGEGGGGRAGRDNYRLSRKASSLSGGR